MDTANPRPDLIEAVLRVNDKVPGLRIIVDHLPSMMRRVDASALAAVEPSLRELAKRPTIYIKVSELMRMEDGKPSTDPAVYKPLLDRFFETFGEDKLIFGSDWPNGPAVDNLQAIVQIVQDYFYARVGRWPKSTSGRTRWRLINGLARTPASRNSAGSAGGPPPVPATCTGTLSRAGWRARRTKGVVAQIAARRSPTGSWRRRWRGRAAASSRRHPDTV